MFLLSDLNIFLSYTHSNTLKHYYLFILLLFLQQIMKVVKLEFCTLFSRGGEKFPGRVEKGTKTYHFQKMIHFFQEVITHYFFWQGRGEELPLPSPPSYTHRPAVFQMKTHSASYFSVLIKRFETYQRRSTTLNEDIVKK
jgi:hypothetical protein